jgi:hypothetical protein
VDNPTITITRTITFTLYPRTDVTASEAEAYLATIASGTRLFATDTIPAELASIGFSGTITASIYHSDQSLSLDSVIADPNSGGTG